MATRSRALSAIAPIRAAAADKPPMSTDQPILTTDQIAAVLGGTIIEVSENRTRPVCAPSAR